MPESTECIYNGQRTTVPEALAIRKQQGSRFRPGPFTCIKCGHPVRPYKGGGHVQAHFQHYERNPKCSLSHQLRETGRKSKKSFEIYQINDKRAIEGYDQDRLLLVQKRARQIVELRKKKDNYTCQACCFQLKINGSYIIECHHTVPVSSAGVREISIKDLVCLCPTCHRIAHTRSEPYTVEEIKQLLSKP